MTAGVEGWNIKKNERLISHATYGPIGELGDCTKGMNIKELTQRFAGNIIFYFILHGYITK